MSNFAVSIGVIPLVAVLVAVTIVVGGEGPVDAGPPGIYDALSA